MATRSRAHGVLRNRKSTGMSSGTRCNSGVVVPDDIPVLLRLRSTPCALLRVHDCTFGRRALEGFINEVACASACLYHEFISIVL